MLNRCILKGNFCNFKKSLLQYLLLKHGKKADFNLNGSTRQKHIDYYGSKFQ